MKKFLAFFAIIALSLCFFFVSCNNSKTENKTQETKTPTALVPSISLTTTELELKVGEKYSINPSVTNIESFTLSYEISDTSVLSNNNGEIEALKEGRATVTIKINEASNVSVVLNVTVIDDSPKTPTVVLNPSVKIVGESTVIYGGSLILRAELTDIDSSAAVVWESSDESIATVNGGIVTGVKGGNVTITCKVGDVSDSKVIEVIDNRVFSLIINEDNATIGVGDELSLTVTLENLDGEVTWTSSDESVATVSDGLVNALASGVTTITATLGDYSDSIEVTVSGEPTLTIVNKPTVVYIAKSYSLEVSALNTTEKVSFRSSNPDVAMISSRGIIVGLAEGTVTITVSCGELSESFSVSVEEVSITLRYDFDGGVSEDLLLANKSSAPSYEINNYNYNNGAFWSGRYSDDIFLGDKNHNPGATFSIRIYIGFNSDLGLYEVVNKQLSGASSWPSNALYVLTISTSYKSYYSCNTVQAKINEGDIIAFDKDFTTMSGDAPGHIYFFSSLPTSSIVTAKADKNTTLLTPGRLGFKFAGWYTDEGVKFTENDLKNNTLEFGVINLKAHWDELQPVTDISVSNFPEEMRTGEVVKVSASVVPSDAYFKSVYFKSSNTDLATIDSDGTLRALNTGKVIITIYDYLNKAPKELELNIYAVTSVDVSFDTDFNGYLSVDDNVNIIATAYGKDTSNVTFTYASSNDTVVSVDANGRMTALAKGEADITVSFSNDSNVNLTFKVQVNDLDNSTDVDKVLELLVANHFDVVETGNVSIYDDGREKYYQSVYGSVNRFLFDEYVVNTKYVETAVNTGTCHSTRDSQDTIQLVCVHDTATLTGTVENIASGMAAATGNGASIHYTVGNLKIYQVVPEYLIAWHAGDGTGVKFYWTASGVKTATNTEPVYDVKRVDNTYYLVINNEVSKIALPSTGSSITKSILTELGPVWKIENGEYYIGNLWYSSTYGKIASKGGNNNAIGIEMNVNISNDIYDTWQRTAQLVTDILIRYDLDTSRVKMHNTFSGKYCPECLIASGYWPGFMKMVQVRYDIMKNYPDAKITMKSNNSDIVDDTGRVINPPRTTTQVSYDITVTIGSTSKTITLYSIIPGTTTWEQWNGTHPSSQVWNNGKFVR